MVDTFSKEKRSLIMSHIRSENTSLEKTVFCYLRKKNIYFQKHYRKAPGDPDIALPRNKKAVFIDGDFWHGKNFEHEEKRLPKEYWREKIRKNIERDKKNRAALRKQGWKVLRIWECELKHKKDATLKKIEKFLTRD